MAEQTEKKPKKKGSFWKSKAAVRLYMVVGIPMIALLAWYGYTVTYELNKPAMTNFEAELAAKMKKLMEKKVDTVHFDACEHMTDEYVTPKGWDYSDRALYELVGLSKKATKIQLEDRCIYFAKVVPRMEQLSHHVRHVFVCKESYLDVGENGKQYIKADRRGRGAIVSLIKGQEDLIPIPRGESTIYKFWQIFNVGDGCVIIGISKSGAFRMKGHVVKATEADGKQEEGQAPEKKPAN